MDFEKMMQKDGYVKLKMDAVKKLNIVWQYVRLLENGEDFLLVEAQREDEQKDTEWIEMIIEKNHLLKSEQKRISQ